MTEDLPNIDKKKILKELISRQLLDVPQDKRLQYRDLCRITKYLSSSIFGNECCIWKGYITNIKNARKGTYINFFFRNKKVAIHRLFYANFVGELSDDEYIKFNCDRKGKCCNINHLIKYKYNIAEQQPIEKPIKKHIPSYQLTICFD